MTVREADLATLKATLNVPGVSNDDTATRDVDEVRTLVSAVMNRERYVEQRATGRGTQRPGLDDLGPDQDTLDQIWETLGCSGAPDHRRSVMRPGEVQVSPVVFKLLMLLLSVVAVLALVKASWARLRGAARDSSREGEAGVQALDAVDRGDDALVLTPSGWHDRAIALAGAESYRLALRALYFASLVRLHREGWIAYLPSRTNGEYERQLSGAGVALSLECVEAFGRLTREFERGWYGEAQVDKARFERCVRDAELLLAREVERSGGRS